MLKNNYPAFETQYLCDVCGEIIDSPLCMHCLRTEIGAWLTLYPNLRKELLPGLSYYLKNRSNSANISSSVRCIKCGNHKVRVCPTCFEEFVLLKLREMQASKIILKEFFQFFNFNSNRIKLKQLHQK